MATLKQSSMLYIFALHEGPHLQKISEFSYRRDGHESHYPNEYMVALNKDYVSVSLIKRISFKSAYAMIRLINNRIMKKVFSEFYKCMCLTTRLYSI